jgi:hypothetical protein
MTKENPPAIDPRYDPAYQRGFAGTATPTRIHAVDTPKEDRAAAPQRAESARVAAHHPPEERVEPFVVPPAKSASSDEALPESTEARDRDEAPTSVGLTLRGNPWVATLWVVAVLLLTAGFFGTWRSQSIYVGATPINDMNEIVTFQVLQTLSPSLVLVGLLVLAGLFFLHAVSWRARRRLEEA